MVSLALLLLSFLLARAPALSLANERALSRRHHGKQHNEGSDDIDDNNNNNSNDRSGHHNWLKNFSGMYETAWLDVRGEPKSGTTFLEISIYTAVEEVLGTRHSLSDGRHLTYNTSLLSLSSSIAPEPAERGRERDGLSLWFTEKQKHYVKDIYRFDQGTECMYDLNRSWKHGPWYEKKHRRIGDNVTKRLERRRNRTGICDFCTSPNDLECITNTLTIHSDTCVSKINVEKHTRQLFDPETLRRYLYILRDPRDVLLSRCRWINYNINETSLNQIARCMEESLCPVLTWVKQREMYLHAANRSQHFSTYVVCYEALLDYHHNHMHDSAWMHYVHHGLGLNASAEQVLSIQQRMNPDYMKHLENATYRLMDKSPTNRKIKSAGSTNYRDTLVGYDRLLTQMDALYDALEQVYPSPCAMERQAYWNHRERARQKQRPKKDIA